MKIEKKLILSLEQVFGGMMKTAMEPALSFKIASNVVSVSECAEKIKKSYQPVDGFDKYEEARKVLLEGVAGASPNGQYQLTPDQATEFNEKLKAVDAEFQVIIDKQKIYADKFNKMLDDVEEIVIKRIKPGEMTAKIEPSNMVILIKAGIIQDGSEQRDV